jgi:hypothetical protein
VELVRAGCTPESLAKEFEPSAVSIRKWVAQAAIDEGQQTDGLTSEEKQELQRRRREVGIVQQHSNHRSDGLIAGPRQISRRNVREGRQGVPVEPSVQAAGRRTVKVVPSPALDATSMVPPWASTRWRTM